MNRDILTRNQNREPSARTTSCSAGLPQGQLEFRPGIQAALGAVSMAGCNALSLELARSLPLYMTGGTSMPMTASAVISSRRTTAAVASRKFRRAGSDSARMGWR